MLVKFAIKDHIFFHAGGEGATPPPPCIPSLSPGQLGINSFAFCVTKTTTFKKCSKLIEMFKKKSPALF
mgnify:CR=1 FL=1